MKYRHYGLVMVVATLAVVVLWQVMREADVIADRPAASLTHGAMNEVTQASPLPGPVVESPVVNAQPSRPARPASRIRNNLPVPPSSAEKSLAQREAEARTSAEQELRRKAEEDSRNRKTELTGSDEADRRVRQEELAQQSKGVAAIDARTPQQLCADRSNFFSRAICEARECEKPERATLPFCIEMQERRAPKDFTN